jgi:DNA transformation protein
MKSTTSNDFGPKSTEWLNSIGIYSVEDVERMGVAAVYWRLKVAYPHKVTLNMLYGLHAAVLGIPWQAVTPEMKAELRAQVEQLG